MGCDGVLHHHAAFFFRWLHSGPPKRRYPTTSLYGVTTKKSEYPSPWKLQTSKKSRALSVA